MYAHFILPTKFQNFTLGLEFRQIAILVTTQLNILFTSLFFLIFIERERATKGIEEEEMGT